MMVGVPREVKAQEFRVAMPPSAAYQLVKRGHRVLVETELIAGCGLAEACQRQPALLGGINVMAGQLTCKARR